jgi:hypothetical protein
MEVAVSKSTYGVSPLLAFRCYSSDWLRFQSLTVVADGQRFERHVFKHVKEDYDFDGQFLVTCQILPATTDDLRLAKAVAESKDATMRFRGARGMADYTFTAVDRILLKDMLAAYRQLAPSAPAW